MQTYGPASSNAAETISPISPTSPAFQEPFPFEHDFPSMQDWLTVGDLPVYNTEMVQWDSATIAQPPQVQDFPFGQSSTSSQNPWNPQVTTFDNNATTGVIAFEPPRGPGYDAYLAGQEFLDTHQRDVTPTAVSPTIEDSDYEGWQNVTFPSYANSSIPSQGSPQSARGSPFEMIDTPHPTPSPQPHHIDHQHIFTLYPGITKSTQKLPRGRQRALTTKEKKEAREVREAKACWACHLSKIKVWSSSSQQVDRSLLVAVLSVFSWLAM